MTRKPDPYTCPTCAAPWPVRTLAAWCCHPDRPALIAARTDNLTRPKERR